MNKGSGGSFSNGLTRLAKLTNVSLFDSFSQVEKGSWCAGNLQPPLERSHFTFQVVFKVSPFPSHDATWEINVGHIIRILFLPSPCSYPKPQTRLHLWSLGEHGAPARPRLRYWPLSTIMDHFREWGQLGPTLLTRPLPLRSAWVQQDGWLLPLPTSQVSTFPIQAEHE